MNREIQASSELQALCALSARLGRDPRRTQAAGGNTSVKIGGTMWIKGSGLWLAEAEDRDIMVPVDLANLLAALEQGDPRAEKATAFVDQARNPGGLRPSIETSVHAVIPHPVVVHIHCVDTIALAVRTDAEALIAERLGPLGDIGWIFVPYLRPGVPLAHAIAGRLRADTRVIVLGNHGLVVAGDSVAEVAARIERVCGAFAAPIRVAPAADSRRLADAVRDSEYRLPGEARVHALALDPASLAHARGRSLYPDHVIFLGPGIVEAPSAGEGATMRAAPDRDAPPPMLVIPGLGVLLHRSTTKVADAMAGCLADVTARIPAGASVEHLSEAQEYELTHWEAEQYRQALDATHQAQ